MTTKIALFQMQSGIDPAANAERIGAAIEEAARAGAAMIFTPEMSGLLDRDRERAAGHIAKEADDIVLQTACDAARDNRIWVSLGSLAIKDTDGAWVNRSFLIADTGEIVARYDKIHMFDVTLADGEAWRESSAYRAGDRAITASTPLGMLGMAVCYDIRFPALFDILGRAQCAVIACPAAFTVPTGKAHWHILMRARAIEATAFVVAAAQCGGHEDGRTTYGHSVVIDPWGDVILDMGHIPNALGYAKIDLDRIAAVRAQIPNIANRRTIRQQTPRAVPTGSE